jgi:hypothetical protein
MLQKYRHIFSRRRRDIRRRRTEPKCICGGEMNNSHVIIEKIGKGGSGTGD